LCTQTTNNEVTPLLLDNEVCNLEAVPRNTKCRVCKKFIKKNSYAYRLYEIKKTGSKNIATYCNLNHQREHYLYQGKGNKKRYSTFNWGELRKYLNTIDDQISEQLSLAKLTSFWICNIRYPGKIPGESKYGTVFGRVHVIEISVHLEGDKYLKRKTERYDIDGKRLVSISEEERNEFAVCLAKIIETYPDRELKVISKHTKTKLHYALVPNLDKFKL